MHFLRVHPDRITDHAGDVWAVFWHGNPLDGPLPDRSDDARLAVWSGWSGEADVGRGVFEPGLLWRESIWSTLADRLGTRKDLVLVPHARHVLSDFSTTSAWLRECMQEPTARLLLDPVGWLTPAMLDTAEDHIGRTFQAVADGLLPRESIAGVLVRGCTPVEVPWGIELAPCSLDASAFDPTLLAERSLELAGRLGVPLALQTGSFDEDRARLQAPRPQPR